MRGAAPVLPFLTDSAAALDAAVAQIAQAGATSVTPIVLHLRPGAREWYMAWLGLQQLSAESSIALNSPL